MKALKTDKKETAAIRSGLPTRMYKWIQLRWVRLMERCTVSLSKRGLTVWLLGFVFVGITYNILILTGYMVSSEIKVEGIQAPRYVEQPSELLENMLHKSKQRQIKAFRKYMDSLAKSPESRQLYDSILEKHPGLLDSLTSLEGQYK